MRRPRQFVVGSADGLETAAPAEPPPPGLALDESFDDALLVPSGRRVRTSDGPPWPTVTRSYGHATTGAGPVVATPRGPRYLSPDEILRLHAFPDGFAFPDGHGLATRWRLAGNSVHVACVRGVLRRWGP